MFKQFSDVLFEHFLTFLSGTIKDRGLFFNELALTSGTLGTCITIYTSLSSLDKNSFQWWSGWSWSPICTCTELLSIDGSADSEARRAVVVVPIFDPKVKGYILEKKIIINMNKIWFKLVLTWLSYTVIYLLSKFYHAESQTLLRGVSLYQSYHLGKRTPI